MAAARVLRAGMVGGGPGGFIGDVHRHALRLDGKYALVAGVFSRDAAKSREFGTGLGIAADRLYESQEAMAEAEAKLPAEERVEVVVVVTPTPQHAAAVCCFAARGFAVVCDKPLCSTVEEAAAVTAAVARVPFMLIHNYSGYPMIKQARHMVADGRLGAVRKIVAEYEQGWLCSAGQLSSTGSITTLADVGTHALQLLEYVSGCRVEEVCCDAETLTAGPRSPDDCNVLFRASQGVRGVLIASQASAGQGNGLRLRVYGERGGLVWAQESPESLEYMPADAPRQQFVRGGPGVCPAAQSNTRTPVGHPEGFLEAFSNLYGAFHSSLCSAKAGGAAAPPGDYPTAADGAHGVHFVAACLASSEQRKWVRLQS
eukprot:TRINITY_DN56204_c0_g1_i1.p1 TRINITY_DN56204_c0_g1~~TRINITY_DN56204_c0_g1_i1.p1  ORF type:complete len:399 (+),score=143.22 TRINITY_DN56204_c0_g1_i1:84-1199(+)